MHGLLDSPAQVDHTWRQRTRKAEQLLRDDCLALDHVHEATCSILGSPQNPSLLLECTVEEHPQKTEIIEYIEYVLLEALEHYLGVRLEQRTLNFKRPLQEPQQMSAPTLILRATP